MGGPKEGPKGGRKDGKKSLLCSGSVGDDVAKMQGRVKVPVSKASVAKSRAPLAKKPPLAKRE